MMITHEMLRKWGACWSPQRIAGMYRRHKTRAVTARQIAECEDLEPLDRVWVLCHALAEIDTVLCEAWGHGQDEHECRYKRLQLESHGHTGAIILAESAYTAATRAATNAAIDARLGAVADMVPGSSTARVYFAAIDAESLGRKDKYTEQLSELLALIEAREARS